MRHNGKRKKRQKNKKKERKERKNQKEHCIVHCGIVLPLKLNTLVSSSLSRSVHRTEVCVGGKNFLFVGSRSFQENV
jgi:hypothetical protein